MDAACVCFLFLSLVSTVSAVLIGDVQVRLMDGPSSSEGRVEVRRNSNDTWGTVCDDLWGPEDAAVICRQLSLGQWGEAKSFAAYGQGAGPIYLDDVDCRGNESSLSQCQASTWGQHNCMHYEDAGVACYQNRARLKAQATGFNTAQYGLVEFLLDGTTQFVSVCDSGWDDNDARVACRMAGYVDGSALCCSQMGPNYLYYQGSSTSARDMNCQGSELSLNNCSYTRSTSSCSSGRLASAACYNIARGNVDMSFSVRLANGSNVWGRVEVRHRGVWGAVCPDDGSWNDTAARVVCRQAGFQGGVRFGRSRSDVFLGSGWVTQLNCTGAETSLEQCVVTWGQAKSCVPGYVLCYTQSAPEVRLSGGGSNYGRVEVVMDRTTYTVCDDSWTNSDADVVCRERGYSGGRAIQGSYYGAGQGAVALSAVQCLYNDVTLWGCVSQGWLQADSSCSAHNRDASVYCYGPVRLDAGDHSSGILLVSIRGRYYTVCGTGFDDVDATVACRDLGFQGGRALPPGSYGTYSSSMTWRNLTCNGRESSIFNCTYDSSACPWDSYYTNYAAVTCYNGSISNVKTVTLEGGSGGMANSSGRVVVVVGGVRGRVCPTSWDDTDARVLCRQLAFTGGMAMSLSSTGTGPYLLNDVECNGTEASIFNCHEGNQRCSSVTWYPPDIGVLCYRNNPPVLQLVGGRSAREGRVQLVYGGASGTLCAYQYNRQRAATVVCKQLGYVDGSPIDVPGGSGVVALSELNCYGYESSIFMCRNSGFFAVPTAACSDHSLDLGVACVDEVRLLQKSQETNTSVVGIVQLYREGAWRYVCGDFFDDRDAAVACRKLGYSYFRALPRGVLGTAYFSSDNSITGLNCTGAEASLSNCPLAVGGCSNSQYNNYGAVQCSSVSLPRGLRAIAPDTQPGYVRMEVDGLTTFVCSDSWDAVDAGVYCRDLGYQRGAVMGVTSNSPQGALLLYDLGCIDRAFTVTQCIYNTTYSAPCSSSYNKARVYCYNAANDLQVRLSGGAVRHTGRVEVLMGGVWGSVCDFSWSDTEADVVCRSLRFSGGQAASQGQYGSSAAPYYLYYPRCSGSEASLWECPLSSFNVSYSFCSQYPATVMCTGEVKLWPNTTYGALQVLVNETSSEYGYVCSDNFTDTEALVACRTLGFQFGIHMCCSAFGSSYTMGTVNIKRTNMRCRGMEATLKECSYSTSLDYCPSNQYASVVCSNTAPNIGYSVSVEKVTSMTYGRVRVKHMGYWGYVCTDGFDDNDANVVCREAGYTGGVAFDSDVYYYNPSDAAGGVSALRWLSNLQCAGSESTLSRCQNVIWGNVTVCNRYAVAGVFCYDNSAPQLRLVNGTNTMGRLELWADGVGGTACGRYWDDREAMTACRELGFNDGHFLGAGYYGQGSGQMVIDYAYCTGQERSLLTCYLWLAGMRTYSLCGGGHQYDAAIQCFQQVRIAGSPRSNYGRVEVWNNGGWAAVCDDSGFDANAARVACRALGYTQARKQCCSALGPLPSTTQIGVKVTRCSGNEANLMACEVVVNSTCQSGNYVSVLCSNNTIQEQPLNVTVVETVYGSGGYYGGIQVNRYGFWGPVCNDSWDDRDANATCHGLGYNYGVTFYGRDTTGGPMVVGNFQCTGLETSLARCSFSDIDDDVGCSLAIGQTYRVDAGVLCYNNPGVGIRLADGGVNYGRVEVQYEGVWGRVADYYFNDDDATVACRQLGFFGGRSAPYNMQRSGQGKIWMYYLLCGGKERTLFECYNYWNYRLSYSRDANVICHNYTRLTGGDGVSVGVVEVYINNKWGPVCDNQWTATNTRVTCRELGYDDGYHLCCNPYGNTLYPVMDHVQCSGSETKLSDCSHSAPSATLTCDGSVTVACYRGVRPTDYSYQLVGGPNNNTGEVTVTYMNITGRICSDSWDDVDARVVCNEQGFQYGRAYEHFLFTSYYYYYQNSPFWMTGVNCQGTETSLRNCPKTLGGVASCSSGTAAGVMCTSVDGIYYQLGGTNSSFKGRVEISVDGIWGTVCRSYFDSREATVFCRTLGFNEGQVDYSSGSYPNPPRTVYQASFQCTGQESKLEDCPHQGWRPATSSYCTNHQYDANVICYDDIRIGGAYDPSIKQGPVQFYNNGTWYNLCDTGFNDVSARRVCRDLEFVDGKAVCCSAYGSSSYYVSGFSTHANYTLRCDGTETSATTCIRPDNCVSNNYASVVCFNTTDFEDQSYTFDLVGGSKTSGQVAVTHLGVTGRVCNTFWDDNDARVLCRSRGHRDGLAYHYSQFMYQSFSSRGPFWISSVNCTGSEPTLTNCSFSDRLNLGNCSQANLAGVICFNTTGVQYRLANGKRAGEGRVELAVGGVWGSVCDVYWDDREAGVLCRSLNYSDGYAVGGAYFGQGSGPMWLSYLRCAGDETSLDKCPHAGFSEEVVDDGNWYYGCRSHSRDASVICVDRLKLSQGLNASMGAVMVYRNKAWSLICDSALKDSDSQVVCRTFNYAYGVSLSGGVFGAVNAHISIANVRCSGREKSFLQCPYDVSTACGSGMYASVICSNEAFVESDVNVRVVRDDTSEARHGMLEVQVRGVWGGVCAAGFNNKAATVACKQLGFTAGVVYAPYISLFTGSGTTASPNPILMRDVRCNGMENSITDCQYTTTTTTTTSTTWCDYYAPRAGLLCYNDKDGVSYRLAGDTNVTRGRFEMRYAGQWGLLCTYRANAMAARVACRSVGYKDGMTISGTRYTSGTDNMPFWFSYLYCMGNESTIPECRTTGFNMSSPYSWYYTSYCQGSIGPFAVQCYSNDLVISSVRLVGGDNSSGRVEVYLSGPDEWGTVCDDGWTDVDATVICRQLGFNTGSAVVQAGFGQGKGAIWMDDVSCQGTELRLQDCPSLTNGDHNCQHTEDAGVRCSGVYVPTTTIRPTTSSKTDKPGTPTPSPSQKPVTSKQSGSDDSESSNTAAIVVPIVIIALIIAAVGAVVLYRRRRQPNDGLGILTSQGVSPTGRLTFGRSGVVSFRKKVFGGGGGGADMEAEGGISNPTYDNLGAGPRVAVKQDDHADYNSSA